MANPAIVKIIVPFNNWSFTAHLILFFINICVKSRKNVVKSLFYSMINRMFSTKGEIPVLLKRNVFRIVCALFYLPVALLSMFEIINLVMTNSQNRYFLVGGVVFGVLLFLIAAYFNKTKKMVNYCRE